MREIKASEMCDVAGGGKAKSTGWGIVVSLAEEAITKLKEKIDNGDLQPANDNNTNAMGDTH